MNCTKKLPTRKNLRLMGYDYSSDGAYFITFCVKKMQEKLGRVVGCAAPGAPPYIELTEYGTIVYDEIENTPSFYPNISIDKFVVMPNHVHLLAVINNVDNVSNHNHAAEMARPSGISISTVVRIIKRKTNKVYGFNMWQDGYYDHIIRDTDDYVRRWQYINENPIRWSYDRYYFGE